MKKNNQEKKVSQDKSSDQGKHQNDERRLDLGRNPNQRKKPSQGKRLYLGRNPNQGKISNQRKGPDQVNNSDYSKGYKVRGRLKKRKVSLPVPYIILLSLLFLGLAIYGVSSLIPFGRRSAESSSLGISSSSEPASDIDKETSGSRNELSTSEGLITGEGSMIDNLSENTSSSHGQTETIKIDIFAMGDVIIHDSLIEGADQGDGNYNFDHLFAFVKDFLAKGDYLTLNFEGTLAGPRFGGWPLFSAPDEIADAIKDLGTDLVATANNHSYDRGVNGLIRTAQIFQERGLDIVGTRQRTDDPGFHIADVKGIRLGFASYTYETAGNGSNRAINGIVMDEAAYPLLDSFNYYRNDILEKNKLEIRSRIKAMQEAGAELVIFHVHWGEEYETSSNVRQKAFANFLAESGVDLIFGHHPHVLQEMDVLTPVGRNSPTLVFYSLSNVMGNMLFSTHNSVGNAEDAVVASVGIEKNPAGEVRISTAKFLKTYIWKDNRSGKVIHRVVPVRGAMADPSRFGFDSSSIKLIEASSQRIDKILGHEPYTKANIQIGELP